MKTFKEFLNEAAPSDPKAEEWIKTNKEKFKKEYGDDWESVLYATAWKMFGESSTPNIDFDDVVDTITLMTEEEDVPANTMTNGIENPDAKPIFKKSKVFGHPCVEVDSDTYHSCIKGKQPFSRWAKFIEDEDLRDYMRKTFHANHRVLMVDQTSGRMAYIK